MREKQNRVSALEATYKEKINNIINEDKYLLQNCKIIHDTFINEICAPTDLLLKIKDVMIAIEIDGSHHYWGDYKESIPLDKFQDEALEKANYALLHICKSAVNKSNFNERLKKSLLKLATKKSKKIYLK